MKALITRVGSYVTGDAVADAVLRYSLALARRQALDLVEIPFRQAGGTVSHVRFRLGWLVDIDAVSQGEDAQSELTDSTVISDLRARELSLQPNGDGSFRRDEMPAVAGALDEY